MTVLERLQRLLLELLPANGRPVSNVNLVDQWTQAASAAGLTATAEDFSTLREDLVRQGVLIKRAKNGVARKTGSGLAIQHLADLSEVRAEFA